MLHHKGRGGGAQLSTCMEVATHDARGVVVPHLWWCVWRYIVLEAETVGADVNEVEGVCRGARGGPRSTWWEGHGARRGWTTERG